MKTLFLVLALSSIGFAQSGTTVTGGTGGFSGVSAIGAPAHVTPPPPPGFPRSFFKSSWNGTPPSPFPPTDGAGNNATITGDRIWDSGLKWGQFQGTSACNSTWGSSFSPNGITNLLNNVIPLYPMDALYVWGDVPNACQIPGVTDTKCINVNGSNPTSCIPPKDLDVNLAACNLDGTKPPATVHDDCGNGANSIFMAANYKLLNTFGTKMNFTECWNEPDGAGNFWSNAVAVGGTGHPPDAQDQPPLVRLVRMCYDLYQIAHALNPSIQVLSPSFHGPTALTWMDHYVRTTVNDPGCSGACSAAIGGITWPAATVSGLQTFDIWNFHGRGGSGSTGEGSGNNNPEAFLTEYANLATEVAKFPLGPQLKVDDEWGPVNLSQCQSPTPDYLAYYVAVGLTLRASVNLYQEWYYQWDSHAGGCPNAPGTSGPQGNVAGTAWDVTSGWLINSVVSANTQVGNVYTVPLLLNGTIPAEIKWNAADITINTVTSASAGSGGNQTLNCSSGCGGVTAGEYVTVTGFTTTCVVSSVTVVCNNGGFTVQSATSTTIVINNPNAVAETRSGVSVSYRPVKCGTSCASLSADGFSTWTDLAGTVHSVSGGTAQIGAKPVLLK